MASDHSEMSAVINKSQYIPNVITPQEEASLVKCVVQSAAKHFGWQYDSKNHTLIPAERAPDTLQQLAYNLHRKGLMQLIPDQISICDTETDGSFFSEEVYQLILLHPTIATDDKKTEYDVPPMSLLSGSWKYRDGAKPPIIITFRRARIRAKMTTGYDVLRDSVKEKGAIIESGQSGSRGGFYVIHSSNAMTIIKKIRSIIFGHQIPLGVFVNGDMMTVQYINPNGLLWNKYVTAVKFTEAELTSFAVEFA